ncbi:MAG: hypothetical protein FVQ79_02040 [Planctomycetes bacterium]|nr:hypothetical protein [Planctomycetota bacterium]
MRTRGILRPNITAAATVSGADGLRVEEDSSPIANLDAIQDTAIGIFHAIATGAGQDIGDIMVVNTVTTDPDRKADTGAIDAAVGNI